MFVNDYYINTMNLVTVCRDGEKLVITIINAVSISSPAIQQCIHAEWIILHCFTL